MNFSNKPAYPGNNPKLSIGSQKIPLGMFSPIGVAYGAIGKMNGMKYGRGNYNANPVILSEYLHALKRHIAEFEAGKECDAEGVPNLSSALANIDIILCAREAGTLIDDRELIYGYDDVLERLTPIVNQINESNKGKEIRHYTIKDNKPKESNEPQTRYNVF
jgi:hypothetical protein